MISLWQLDPATYRRHDIHTDGRTYSETNCHTDVLIELLHAHGSEPVAMLGSNVRMDFEGDQWTFFKPPGADLEALFGVDIHEMQPYLPLPRQIAEQITAGRTVMVELDSFYLPDTAGLSYREQHVKSSIAAEAIDVEGARLHYFHNKGLHELHGEDFREVFRLSRPFSDDVLPPYTEVVRFDAGPALEGEALRDAALALLRHHLARRPASNPFPRFAAQLADALPGLLAGDAATYHAYAFATARMAGAGFELLATHVDWLFGAAGADASAALGRIVEGTKVLSFRLARRRAFEPAHAIEAMAGEWDLAMAHLDALAGG